jgi:hypothetical protein
VRGKIQVIGPEQTDKIEITKTTIKSNDNAILIMGLIESWTLCFLFSNLPESSKADPG